MDIMMPNLDGCSAAALIRQFNADTPIIAMTSNIRRDDINNYFNNGTIYPDLPSPVEVANFLV
jgi:osomolarity two-component system response regulator SKN7